MKNAKCRALVMTLGLAMSGYADIEFDATVPQIVFAAEKVTAALHGAQANVRFVIQPNSAKPETFAIDRMTDGTIQITGTDAAGAMYGGFEVAELIRIGGVQNVRADAQSPHLEMRGVKFNLPLDVRTPSYSDMGDAGQFNLPHVWDFSFWREFIDEVASHRYNFVSLWNLHPFPSLVKVPEYPEVALADVKRAVGLEKKHYNGRGHGYDAPEILDETETLIRLSIEEKIAFWRKVMRYGKTRNVEFYFVIWNIFDYGARGKHGIDDSAKNPVTADYFRKSVTQLFLTYPDLKGIGITAGENMPGTSHQAKEDWMLQTYGRGVLDVFKTQPDRKITFLHREHEAGAGVIAATFKSLRDHPNVDFIFSYKYAKAHAYSSTKQEFYKEFQKEVQGRADGLKTIWTMRNDSTYLFRLAAPDFLREYVRQIPPGLTRGYYFGSDGWVWGREFISKGGREPRPLELQKHWFQWMMWGRLGYDPNITTERFTGIVQARFPGVAAGRLMEAWQAASMVYPLTTGFHWGPLDYHWYPEACIGFPAFSKTPSGFHDVNRFITLPPHPASGYISIPDYVETIKQGKPFNRTGPEEISAQLLAHADQALFVINTLDAGADDELAETLKDIQAMALLSRYYGYKIAGATRLHHFREMGGKSGQAKAIEALEKAAQAWRAYVANLTGRYMNPLWLGRIRTGPVDFTQITEWVDGDVAIARNDPGKPMTGK